ncbi:hypothetical protein [Weissella viridescens]|uniref:hypothetical protein n=1 Tax=Weissella viridescens TaxID=1629 RepID=UPI00405718C7
MDPNNKKYHLYNKELGFWIGDQDDPTNNDPAFGVTDVPLPNNNLKHVFDEHKNEWLSLNAEEWFKLTSAGSLSKYYDLTNSSDTVNWGNMNNLDYKFLKEPIYQEGLQNGRHLPEIISYKISDTTYSSDGVATLTFNIKVFITAVDQFSNSKLLCIGFETIDGYVSFLGQIKFLDIYKKIDNPVARQPYLINIDNVQLEIPLELLKQNIVTHMFLATFTPAVQMHQQILLSDFADDVLVESTLPVGYALLELDD